MPPAFSAITVEGFKSIAEAQTLGIRPLTILAGANSSGKSSVMQPLLLLKQTLEAQYDPGPLLLNGANVKFTSASQFISFANSKNDIRKFSIVLNTSDGSAVKTAFRVDGKTHKLGLEYNEYAVNNERLTVRYGMPLRDVLKYINLEEEYSKFARSFVDSSSFRWFHVNPERCFLNITLIGFQPLSPQGDEGIGTQIKIELSSPAKGMIESIQGVIHVPGLRGLPERLYPVASSGPRYPGTFEHYVASVVADWGSNQPAKLRDLIGDLHLLGLTWKIEAKSVNDTQVELRVGRLKKKPAREEDDNLVSIADVGLGVSQTLPVLVALRVANPGQLVYIEQPEIHLHPRAQVAMAKVLANAAMRGVRVVVETHSALLLLAVQTLVAEGSLSPGLVSLNWFTRDEDTGTTRIHPAELDEAGRFGDWPEDFADTVLEAENRYLSAAEARLMGNGKDG